MDNYTATEQAYKQGYEKGLRDAARWIPVDVISAYNEGVAYGAEQAVKHGRWMWDKRYGDYYCSECHDYDLETPNFRSNCGARMDLEE